MRLKTPGGKPASSKTLTNAAEMAGVSGDGFQIIVLPAKSAGKIFHEGTAMGKFQGVMSPTTPEGSRTAMPNLFGKDGLPVNLFRTDDCAVDTEAVKK